MKQPFNAVYTVRPATQADVPLIRVIAHRVWHAHYPSIITSAQIEYMLAQRYDVATISAELHSPDIAWDVLQVQGAIVAFASTHLLQEPRELKLDKLYVDLPWQRRGCGERLIERAAARARELQCEALILAVNKHNAQAIGAYRKHGFGVRSEVVKDIGNGFVMDDYIMAREI